MVPTTSRMSVAVGPTNSCLINNRSLTSHLAESHGEPRARASPRLTLAWGFALTGLIGPLASAAVLEDPRLATHSHFAKEGSELRPAQHASGSLLTDLVDLGYFKLEAETCMPLGPAQQTINQLIAATGRLSTAEAASLSFSWRQIQHYRADASKSRLTTLCYYIAR
jgi:hypothetical protein